eukprot:gene8268-8532_t
MPAAGPPEGAVQEVGPLILFPCAFGDCVADMFGMWQRCDLVLGRAGGALVVSPQLPGPPLFVCGCSTVDCVCRSAYDSEDAAPLRNEGELRGLIAYTKELRARVGEWEKAAELGRRSQGRAHDN